MILGPASTPRETAWMSSRRFKILFVCVVVAALWIYTGPRISYKLPSRLSYNRGAGQPTSLGQPNSPQSSAPPDTKSGTSPQAGDVPLPILTGQDPNAPQPLPNPPLPPADESQYLALCLLVKNQSIDMPEFFIHHYYHHGIRKFYVYDDGSQPQLSEHPYISSYGIPSSAIHFNYVRPEDIKDRESLQIDTYTDCVKRYAEQHVWFGLLDPDEFVEMRGPNPPNLIDYLKDWEKNDTVGALAIHWLSHNSAGHVKRPAGTIRKSYTTCLPNEHGKANRHVKSFVRASAFDRIENIHYMIPRNGTVQVAEGGDIVDMWEHYPISHNHWALHHYATKSREDYELKKSRHRVGGADLGDWWWDEMHSTTDLECKELAGYEP